MTTLQTNAATVTPTRWLALAALVVLSHAGIAVRYDWRPGRFAVAYLLDWQRVQYPVRYDVRRVHQ